MSRPHPHQPNPAIERLYREAEEAWGRQDYQAGIKLIERAARKEPGNPSLLLNLARAYGRRYEFPAAERCLEKAVQVSTDRARALGDAGCACLEFDQAEMGIRYLERACRNKAVSTGVLMTLADLYIRGARADAASALLERAARLEPRDPRVQLEQASLRRLQGKPDEALSLLRALLAGPNIGVSVKIRGLYELAGILDCGGQYAEAMSALLEAKAVQRTEAAPYAATLQHIQNRAREMEGTITSAVLDRWRADASKLQPPRRIALLCGHPRSGTTLLEQVLDAHSDIIAAEETKLMHDEAYLPLIRDFPEGTSILQALDSSAPGLICRARENYFRCAELLLRRPIGTRLLLDKNPSLNVMIPMVVRVFPETKFLVALRDPRDVVVSCFLQALPLTPISSAYLSLESTVNQYASVMGFWLEMLPRMGNQWMHVRYEELVDDLPAVARSVCQFLGVGFEENVLKFYEHARTKRVNSPSSADVQKPLYRTAVGRWRNYQKYLEPYLSRLDRFLKAFDYA